MIKHTGFHNKEHCSPECPECRQSVVVGKWAGDNEVCLDCGVSRTVLRKFLSGSRSERTILNHILEGCPSCAKALGGKQ